MEIKHKFINGTLLVSLHGELDETAADNARSFLDLLIDKKAPKRVVFELEGLSFMDSTGIGVLLGRYKRCKAAGVSVMISSPRQNIDKLLNLSGIYTIMPKIS